MTRLITKTAHGPVEVKIGDKSVWVCRCGLSKNAQGLCDKSHLKTLDENDKKVYVYDENLNRNEFGCECDGECDCEEKCDCGGECSCQKDNNNKKEDTKCDCNCNKDPNCKCSCHTKTN